MVPHDVVHSNLFVTVLVAFLVIGTAQSFVILRQLSNNTRITKALDVFRKERNVWRSRAIGLGWTDSGGLIPRGGEYVPVPAPDAYLRLDVHDAARARHVSTDRAPCCRDGEIALAGFEACKPRAAGPCQPDSTPEAVL